MVREPNGDDTNCPFRFIYLSMMGDMVIGDPEALGGFSVGFP